MSTTSSASDTSSIELEGSRALVRGVTQAQRDDLEWARADADPASAVGLQRSDRCLVEADPLPGGGAHQRPEADLPRGLEQVDSAYDDAVRLAPRQHRGESEAVAIDLEQRSGGRESPFVQTGADATTLAADIRQLLE